MKFTLVSLFALALVQAVSAAPAPDATVDEVGPTATAKVHATHTTLEKRAVVATVTADALRYRTCPRTSCTAVGQYPRGTRVTVECFTTTNTTPVNGDPGWGRLSNGYWASLYYLDWPGFIYGC